MATPAMTPKSSIFGGIIAFVIERFFGHYVTTIAGILSATVTYMGAFTSVIPPHYASAFTAFGILLSATVGALAKDSSTTPAK